MFLSWAVRERGGAQSDLPMSARADRARHGSIVSSLYCFNCAFLSLFLSWAYFGIPRVSWAMSWERVTRLDDSRNERRRVIFFPFAIENAYRPTGAFRTNTAAVRTNVSSLSTSTVRVTHILQAAMRCVDFDIIFGSQATFEIDVSRYNLSFCPAQAEH